MKEDTRRIIINSMFMYNGCDDDVFIPMVSSPNNTNMSHTVETRPSGYQENTCDVSNIPIPYQSSHGLPSDRQTESIEETNPPLIQERFEMYHEDGNYLRTISLQTNGLPREHSQIDMAHAQFYPTNPCSKNCNEVSNTSVTGDQCNERREERLHISERTLRNDESLGSQIPPSLSFDLSPSRVDPFQSSSTNHTTTGETDSNPSSPSNQIRSSINIGNESCDLATTSDGGERQMHDDPPEPPPTEERFLVRIASRKNTALPVLRRKRSRNKTKWIDVAAKKARDAGIAGVGRDNREIIARKMKEGCGKTCRRKCKGKVSKRERKSALKTFWKLGNRSKQWACLTQWCVDGKSLPDSQMNKNLDEHDDAYDTDPEIDQNEKNGSRGMNIIYRIPNQANKLIQVCRKTFLDTLDISYQWVRTAFEKLNCNPSKAEIEDQRGKHNSRPFKTPEIVKDTAREHIRIYEQIFNTEFNYGFFTPKKDRCDQCEVFKNSTDAEKRALREALDEHLLNKRAARALMNQSQRISEEDPSVCTMNIDLQKILTTPKSQQSSMYYMSKLCIWNFTIHLLGIHVGICNVWNETIGKRGSTEIASFLYDFLLSKASEGIKEFHIYGDNCAGQNRNQNVSSMLMKLCLEWDVTIYFRFLEVGHTQQPGDSMHSVIEAYTKNKTIYTQKQWCRYMRNAKVTGEKYNVVSKNQEDIYDFGPLAKCFNWEKCGISQICEIVFRPNNGGIVEIRKKFSEDPEPIAVLKKTKRIADVIRMNLLPAYTEKIPLSQNKQNDLRKMIQKKYIKSKYIPWYEDLLA
ncbi:hypothetical protein QAD02_013042 [Eretmocerus hayati]|uniref:Uncharacterized protein n=1 Tax=Eretmocerus hayati TaxID=131215 RepID=A0ACC2P1I1_9HYME|nr:hypothetical protein QAD02_013042 [Eretmocerus hayati]